MNWSIRRLRMERSLLNLPTLGLVLVATWLTSQPAYAQVLPKVPSKTADGLPTVSLIRVKRIVFIGRTAVDESVLMELAKPLLARELRYDDLEELRQQVNKAYFDRGYVSSGALVETFEAATSTLTVRIIEGTVSDVRLTGGERLSSAYVASRLTRPEEPFHVGTLEDRFRVLLADPLFRRLDVRVLPGEALGQTVIAIDSERARAVEVALFANNQQAPSVGSSVIGTDWTVRNLAGWGDSASVNVTRSKGGINYDVGWALPLGAARTVLGARFSRGHSAVVEEPLAQLDVDSVISGGEVSLSHPVIDTASTRFQIGASVGRRTNRTTLGDEPFSFVAGEDSGTNQASTQRIFGELTRREGAQLMSARFTLTAGHTNLPADKALDEQPERHFTTLLGQGQWIFSLGPDGSQLVMRGIAQLTADRLLPMEQFSIGGRQTVRGYRENQLVRDRGAAGSIEYRTPFVWGSLPWQQITLAAFADVGVAANVNQASARLSSVGIGVLWQQKDLNLELYWGKPLRNVAKPQQRDLQDDGINLSFRWRAF